MPYYQIGTQGPITQDREGHTIASIDVYDEQACLEHIRRLVEADDVLFGPHALNAMEQESPRFTVDDVFEALGSG